VSNDDPDVAVALALAVAPSLVPLVTAITLEDDVGAADELETRVLVVLVVLATVLLLVELCDVFVLDGFTSTELLSGVGVGFGVVFDVDGDGFGFGGCGSSDPPAPNTHEP
jgi:hypothetical protein